MRKTLLAFLSVGVIMLVFSGPSLATQYTIPLSVGISFQNEGTTLQYDDTNNLRAQDGIAGPTVGGGVEFNYYATGKSGRWFDAVSLAFDTSSVQYPDNVHSLTLRFFLQTGDYASVPNSNGTTWHHYQVLNGRFANENEDSHAGALGSVSFDYDAYKNGGWIEAALDTAWFADPTFEVTLRLWNARLDAVELSLVNGPVVPEPATLLLLGFGLAGVGGLSRRKLKK